MVPIVIRDDTRLAGTTASPLGWLGLHQLSDWRCVCQVRGVDDHSADQVIWSRKHTRALGTMPQLGQYGDLTEPNGSREGAQYGLLSAEGAHILRRANHLPVPGRFPDEHAQGW